MNEIDVNEMKREDTTDGKSEYCGRSVGGKDGRTG